MRITWAPQGQTKENERGMLDNQTQKRDTALAEGALLPAHSNLVTFTNWTTAVLMYTRTGQVADER